LENRTAIANRCEADLFLSIHANSSANRGASGVETYFLDFARTSAEREIAARENAATVHTYRDLEELVKKIARADKMAESRELAGFVQKALYGEVRQVFSSTKNRGVRSAPFVVLIGAKMPSVLVEVAFLSNPRDEKLLKKEPTLQNVAKALCLGIEGYMKALGSHVARIQANASP
jgi:N-acetylmuramoyl-L-alanine amidase